VAPAEGQHPPKGSGPGILVLQEIFAVSAYIERRAADLAALGYVVVAPEIFWRLGVSTVVNVAAGFGPDELVSCYGSALPVLLGLAPPEPGIPTLAAGQATAASLHHFGLSDSFLGRPAVENVHEVLAALPQVVFESYENADHAFDKDDFVLFDADASALAWQRTVDFLRHRLPAG
jgi:carboxymethylenebutenolidase